MEDLCIPGPTAAQLTYHMGMAVAFAAADDTLQCASETTLAWTLLSSYDTNTSEFVADLPEPGVAAASERQWDTLQRRTETLARALQAHFVSEGQQATAAIYAAAEARVGDVIAALRDRR